MCRTESHLYLWDRLWVRFGWDWDSRRSRWPLLVLGPPGSVRLGFTFAGKGGIFSIFSVDLASHGVHHGLTHSLWGSFSLSSQLAGSLFVVLSGLGRVFFGFAVVTRVLGWDADHGSTDSEAAVMSVWNVVFALRCSQTARHCTMLTRRRMQADAWFLQQSVTFWLLSGVCWTMMRSIPPGRGDQKHFAGRALSLSW